VLTWNSLYRHALIMGLKPDEFWGMTLREFAWCREGWIARQSAMWDHTASIMALLANVNSGKGKRFEPGDFHPFTTQSNQGVRTAADAEALLEKMRKF